MARNSKPKCVAVTRFSALGDVALSIPVIYSAAKANPETRFVVVTRKLPSRLFINPPANVTAVGIDTSAYKGVGGIRRLFRELREAYGFDAVADLHDVIRTRIFRLIARLSGLRVAHINKGRREKKALTRSGSKAILQLKPTPERYRDVFSRLGISAPPDFSTLFPDGKADPALFAKASAPKKEGERWIAVAPFAAHAGKVYPLHLMKKVTDHYASQPATKVFVFGAGEKEKEEIDTLAAGKPQVVNMAALRIGMEGELALMNHCDTMLAMDSANMHLAGLAGLRAVSVWGATHPFTGFYGIGQDPADAVQLDMVCRPCSVFGNKPCRRADYHCLNGIPPQMIISRIDSPSRHT